MSKGLAIKLEQKAELTQTNGKEPGLEDAGPRTATSWKCDPLWSHLAVGGRLGVGQAMELTWRSSDEVVRRVYLRTAPRPHEGVQNVTAPTVAGTDVGHDAVDQPRRMAAATHSLCLM